MKVSGVGCQVSGFRDSPSPYETTLDRNSKLIERSMFDVHF